MHRVLVCASNAVHIRNFHLPYLAYFKRRGFEVHVAVPEPGDLENADAVHDIPITKRLFAMKNLAAALRVRRLVRACAFDLIIVHTTLAAFVVRLGLLPCRKARPPLVNTVHGYFFWKGCGFLRKVAYYLPERLLRSVTDGIVVMNGEDAAAARTLVKKGGFVVKVRGMGVDAARFRPADEASRRGARASLDIPDDAFVIVYPAEFSKRKNHMELLEALDMACKRDLGLVLLLCGTGALETRLRGEIAKRKLDARVRFLGWCDRMEQIYAAADMAVSSSKSEGLPFNIVEAQLCALPVAASWIRGHTDLIRHGETGLLYPPGNAGQLTEAILAVKNNPDMAKSIGSAARQSALGFTLDAAFQDNIRAYQMALDMNER